MNVLIDKKPEETNNDSHQSARVKTNYTYEELMTQRRLMIADQCQILKNKSQEELNNVEKAIITQSFLSHVLIMEDRKFFWCPVYKAGSSSWRYYFLDIYPSMSEVRFRDKMAIMSSNQPLFTQEDKVKLGKKYESRNDQIVNSIMTRFTRAKRELQLKVLEGDNFEGLIIVRHPFSRLVAAFR